MRIIRPKIHEILGGKNQVEPKIFREKISDRSSARDKKNVFHLPLDIFENSKQKVFWSYGNHLRAFLLPIKEVWRRDAKKVILPRSLNKLQRSGQAHFLGFAARAPLSQNETTCWLGWVLRGFFSYCPPFSKASTLHILNRLGVCPLPS